MLFSYITNCISTYASKISILSVIVHDIEFLLLKFVSILKLVKVREFYEFLKFIKFAFSIYALCRNCLCTQRPMFSTKTVSATVIIWACLSLHIWHYLACFRASFYALGNVNESINSGETAPNVPSTVSDALVSLSSDSITSICCGLVAQRIESPKTSVVSTGISKPNEPESHRLPIMVYGRW